MMNTTAQFQRQQHELTAHTSGEHFYSNTSGGHISRNTSDGHIYSNKIALVLMTVNLRKIRLLWFLAD